MKYGCLIGHSGRPQESERVHLVHFVFLSSTRTQSDVRTRKKPRDPSWSPSEYDGVSGRGRLGRGPRDERREVESRGVTYQTECNKRRDELGKKQ